MGVDLNRHGFGMRFANSVNPEGFEIDGKTSEAEKNVDTTHDTWRYYAGPPGTSVLRGTYDKRLAKYADFATIYVDDIDAPLPPENFPGQIGYSYDVSFGKAMLRRWFMTYFELYVTENFHYLEEADKQQKLQEILNIRENPLEIMVDGLEEATNEASAAMPLSLL